MAENDLRVLVVDDTVLYRKVLTMVLSEIPGVEVVGTAINGKLALAKLGQLQPDLITLDFEMPEMDGLETLRQLRASGSNTPVVMISSHTKEGASVTMEALQLGAFTFVTKPDAVNPMDAQGQLLKQLQPVIASVINQTRGRTSVARPTTSTPKPVAEQTRTEAPPTPARPQATPDAGQPLSVPPPLPSAGFVKVVALGISTGGPNALTVVIPKLPGNLRVPVLIVQHMPPVFTTALAESLDQKSKVKVLEGRDGMVIVAGTVYIAPGGMQMRVARRGSDLVLETTDDPPENHCKPAADYLFRSVAEHYGNRALGVIMTGMGSDGVLGLKVMKEQGIQVLAQDQQSCVVFGMPAEAIQVGVVDLVVPLDRIAAEIVKRVN